MIVLGDEKSVELPAADDVFSGKLIVLNLVVALKDNDEAEAVELMSSVP